MRATSSDAYSRPAGDASPLVESASACLLSPWVSEACLVSEGTLGLRKPCAVPEGVVYPRETADEGTMVGGSEGRPWAVVTLLRSMVWAGGSDAL